MSVHIRYRFYKDMKNRAKVVNIWRTKAGEANYRMEEEERLSWE